MVRALAGDSTMTSGFPWGGAALGRSDVFFGVGAGAPGNGSRLFRAGFFSAMSARGNPRLHQDTRDGPLWGGGTPSGAHPEGKVPMPDIEQGQEDFQGGPGQVGDDAPVPDGVGGQAQVV